MVLKQILYLGHWFLTLDRPEFFSFLNYAQMKSNRTKIGLLSDIVYCVLSYKMSIMEYFQFNFFLIGKEERKKYIGTPAMRPYQLKMNPKSEANNIHNKLKFLEIYAHFVKRSYATLADFQSNNETAKKVLRNKSGKIVLKSIFGERGIGIVVMSVAGLDSEAIVKRLKETKNDFAEENVVQHKDLMKLAPSGLNTLRIITQLNKNDGVEILGATLRISINSNIDNWSAGNIGAPINLSTGIVEGPGFYKDITKPEENEHPVTGVKIVGFQIPYWKEALQLAKDAALHNKRNRSVGWDIAVTDNGPDLIEGNHDWCKVFWQRSAKKGLKSLIESNF
jgi:hypothetical protein